MIKTSIRILSLIISAIMIFSMFGCSFKKGTAEVSDKDGGKIDVEAQTNADGDLVIVNEVTDKDGNKTEVTEIVDSTGVDKLIPASSGVTKRENFVEIAKQNYSMPEDVAESVVKDEENWKEFYVTEYIRNKSDKHMAYNSIRIENNGENGLWLSKDLQADYTIAPGTSDMINIWVLADVSKFEDDDAIDAAFLKTKFNLVYTLIDDYMADVEWDKSDVKELVIH